MQRVQRYIFFTAPNNTLRHGHKIYQDREPDLEVCDMVVNTLSDPCNLAQIHPSSLSAWHCWVQQKRLSPVPLFRTKNGAEVAEKSWKNRMRAEMTVWVWQGVSRSQVQHKAQLFE